MSMTQDQEVEMFGPAEARWFQVAARNQVREALLEGHRRICFILPTGAGKTITSGLILVDDMIREFLKIEEGKPIRVLFACHRHRLLSQAEQTYAHDERIQVITQSIASPIPEDLEFDIVLIDEAHHEATLSFQKQLERLCDAPIIGMTATPDGRNDGRLCKFSKFIEPITREEAVQQGYLAESYVYTFVDSPSRTHVEMCEDIIKMHHHTMGQNMVFVRTKAEAQDLHERIKKMGLTSSLLIDISENALNERLAAFEQKQFQYAISCMKIGEGVDVKGCEGVLIGRTLKSRNLINQIVGRAARIGSDCRIYEIINPLANDNRSAIDVVGVPKEHHMFFKVRGEWRTHQLT